VPCLIISSRCSTRFLTVRLLIAFYLFLKMLCTDTTEHDTMFRIVVKSNLTMYLAEDLVKKLDEVVPLLDKLKGEVKSLKRESQRKRRSSYIHVC